MDGGGWQRYSCCSIPQELISLVNSRHIDTSLNYDNQVGTGMAIQSSGIPREQLYITSKYDAINGGEVKDEIHTTLKQVRLSIE